MECPLPFLVELPDDCEGELLLSFAVADGGYIKGYVGNALAGKHSTGFDTGFPLKLVLTGKVGCAKEFVKEGTKEVRCPGPAAPFCALEVSYQLKVGASFEGSVSVGTTVMLKAHRVLSESGLTIIEPPAIGYDLEAAVGIEFNAGVTAKVGVDFIASAGASASINAKCDLSAGLSTGVSDVECSYNMAAIVEAGIFQPMEVPSITLGGGGSVCDKEASKGFETDAIQIPPPHPFTLGVVHEVYSGKEMSMQIAPAPARK